MKEKEIKEINNSVFENIKHIDNNGNEYWLGRELMIVLKYTKWENFKKAIDKSIISCKSSSNNTSTNGCYNTKYYRGYPVTSIAGGSKDFDGAFQSKGLTSVKIPSSVTLIGDIAFSENAININNNRK